MSHQCQRSCVSLKIVQIAVVLIDAGTPGLACPSSLLSSSSPPSTSFPLSACQVFSLVFESPMLMHLSLSLDFAKKSPRWILLTNDIYNLCSYAWFILHICAKIFLLFFHKLSERLITGTRVGTTSSSEKSIIFINVSDEKYCLDQLQQVQQ